MTITTAPTTPSTAADLAALRRSVRGPVLTRDDAGLPTEVATFNLAVTHRPAVVVGATGADDVVAAVRWAGEQGLPVAVQATGHGPMQPVEDALLITTGRMRTVEVDAEQRTARVEAGARWADVLAEASPHGLTGVAGSSSQVGVVGYSVGGGMGPLGRRYGYGADLVRRLEIVTADGRLRHVDADADPDLFWAVRGGKGNFGVVTSVEIDLVPVPSLFAGAVFLSGGDAAAVLHSFRTWAPTLPDRASTSLALLNLPPLDAVPEPLRGRYVVVLRFALDGTDAEGDALLAPMREAGEVLLDSVGRIPSSATDLIHQDPRDPMPVWEKGALLSELTAGAVDALLEVAGEGRAPHLAMVELRLMGGALGRPARVPNAVSGREGAYSLLTLGVLAPGIADDVRLEGEAVHEAVAGWTTGTAPVNWIGPSATPAEVAAAWRPEVLRRLLEVKGRVDPDNMFRFGHAIVG